MACDELIDVAGRATIQAVLALSAEQAAGGPRQRANSDGEVVWYGRQAGTVMLSDRKLAVQRPRLRQKGPGGTKRWKSPPIKPCKISRDWGHGCWTS